MWWLKAAISRRALPLLLWVIRRYFLGRVVLCEMHKVAVEGRIAFVTLHEGDMVFGWTQNGGGIYDTKRFSARDLRRNGKTWVFDA